jgi:hypothetical protein
VVDIWLEGPEELIFFAHFFARFGARAPHYILAIVA